jgi:bacillithiol system protein YtxJ
VKTIVSEDEVEALIKSPGPVWLLKHSNACSISSAALAEFRAYSDAHPDEAAALLVIQEQRPLSNWIAKRLGFVHQSPQLFLLMDGKVRWSATHWSITAAAMTKARG